MSAPAAGGGRAPETRECGIHVGYEEKGSGI